MAGEKVVKDGQIVDADDDNDVVDNDDIDQDDLDAAGVDDDDVDDDDDKGGEAWMADEEGQPPSTVPVGTHIRMKQKLKGRLSSQNDELTRLREENAQLKAGQRTQQSSKPPVRPKENDFETLAEFDKALADYDQKMVDFRLQAANQKNAAQQMQLAAKAKLEEAVDGHYTRAAKLIQDNGIDTEVYQQADQTVREAIETLMPGRGDLVTDQIISVLGEGSEKVMYYLGRNKNALNELKTLLVEDPTGLKSSLYLGQQRERLLNNKQRLSKAPAPGKKVKGDATPTSAQEKSLLKKRRAAVKAGNIQLAYDIKKQAKQEGIDVSTW